MAASLLALKGGVTFLDATAEVMAKRPEANPHPSVLASASLLCCQPLTLAELRRVYTLQPLPRRTSWPEGMYKDAIEQMRDGRIASRSDHYSLSGSESAICAVAWTIFRGKP